ncbi:MAG: OB-fold nucleic acid binding domain-containing protein, partial [Thermoleophilia bacterium]|nr:OB-fold nucleic acid binding domain-containing protein [Thermoleophilia bacterium]
SLPDFIARTRVSREIAENLVRAGAFDTLGVRREELVAQLPLLYAGSRPGGQRGAGDEAGPATAGLDQPRLALDDRLAPLDFIPSWSLEQRVRAELEVLGLNVSAHPLRFVHDELRALRVTPFAELAAVPNGRRVRLAGVLERAQMPWVRSGHRTLFLTLEDETELAQVVVFNDVYLKYGRVLKDSLYLYVEGELQNSEEHGLAVVAQRVDDLLRVVGRAPGRRPGRPVGNVPVPAQELPSGAGPRRADAWELPGVQPQTRPGRTG